MIDLLRSLAAGTGSPLAARNVAREYLQIRILESMQRSGAMLPLAFHGGTALRLLYGTPRYSEDLDFALERAEAAPFDLESCLKSIHQTLHKEGYEVATSVKLERTVQIGWVRFPGLPHRLGLSAHQTETFAVKLEVDRDPPAGAGLATTLIRRHVPLQLQHHDRPSLLAKKIAATLLRPWTKGRDLFDLFWYLSDPEWPAPNLVLLGNAIRQAQEDYDADRITAWREMARERIVSLEWHQVVSDVTPFLEEGRATDLFTVENLLGLLEDAS